MSGGCVSSDPLGGTHRHPRRPTPPDDRGLPDRGLGQRADDPDGGLRGTRQTRAPPNTAKHRQTHTKHPPYQTPTPSTAESNNQTPHSTPSATSSAARSHSRRTVIRRSHNVSRRRTARAPPHSARVVAHSEPSLVWNGHDDPRRDPSSTSSFTGWASSGTQRIISHVTDMTTHDAVRAQPRAPLGGRAPEGRRLGRALLDRHPAQGVRLHDLRQRADVRHLTVCHHSDTNVSSQRSSPL